MIIDAHSHVHASLESHLAQMDEAGVDRSVLFATRAHPERAADLAALRREMSVLSAALDGTGGGHETAWQELDSALTTYRERFIGFRSVRLDRPAAEIAAVVQQEIVGHGYRGVGELTPEPGQSGSIEPVLQAASDHSGLVVVVHGAAPTTAADIARLGRLAGRYPTVALMISQLGGVHWMSAIDVARDHPNVYLDLSTAAVVLGVRLAVREIPDRLVFGSDAPYGDPVVARTIVERVTRPGSLRDRVLGENIAQLLGC